MVRFQAGRYFLVRRVAAVEMVVDVFAHVAGLFGSLRYGANLDPGSDGDSGLQQRDVVEFSK